MNDKERFSKLIRGRMEFDMRVPLLPVRLKSLFSQFTAVITTAAIEADREMSETGIHDRKLFDAGVTVLTFLKLGKDTDAATLADFLERCLKAEGASDGDVEDILTRTGLWIYRDQEYKEKNL